MNARPKTKEFHRTQGRHLVMVWGKDRLVAPLILADVNKYVDDRLVEVADGGEPTIKQRHQIQKEIRVLITALRAAKEMNLYHGDASSLRPAAFKKQKLYYKPGSVWLEKPEYCQALIDHTSDSTRVRVNRKLHIAAYLHLGVRRDELQLIYPEHVNLEKRTVWVDGTKTDGSARSVSLSDTAVEIMKLKLKGAKAGKPLFERWGKIDRDLKANWKRARAWLIAKARKQEGEDAAEALIRTLPLSLCCNDLRRTFCSLMAEAGVPLHHCADLLGHKGLDMVMAIYRRVSPPSLLAAVSKLPTFDLAVTAAVTNQMRKSGVAAQVARGRAKLSA